jgi:chaperonin GroEL
VSRPRILFANKATLALKQGFDQMAELLALTLGPTQGNILSERDTGAPEWLGDSATIARRILEFPDQAANVGAMLMRSLAWRTHLRAGDGVATTAVLAQAILREAFRYAQAGGNVMLMKRGLDQAARVALTELTAQARPVTGEEALTQVAQAITAEPKLSLILGEMFDVLGAEAHITIEDYVAPYLERAYYEGGRWKARLESPYFMTDQAGKRAIQTDCQVVLFAGRLETLEDIQPVLELLAKHKKRQLLLVTYEVKGAALGTLVANHQKETFKIIAISLQRPGNRRADDFADLALMTGANLLEVGIGQTLSDLTIADVGFARRVVASNKELVISGGGGAAAARRETIQQLQGFMSRLPETDEQERDEVQLRLARLSGGIGVLKVGAYSKLERQNLHQHAEKATRSLRLAMREGVAPGGGVAYLNTIPAVEALIATLEGDEQHGARILARALEEPFRRIVQNRGLTSPSVALANVRRMGAEYVYDAIADRVVPWSEDGLLDPAGTLRIALETGVSGAMLALTTGVLVLHRKPEQSLEP